MTRSKNLTFWLFLWFAALGLNSVLVAIHAGHGHNICPHGEITHDDQGSDEESTPQTSSQWASIHAAHQHCATSPWSRTAAGKALSPLEMIRDLPVAQVVLAPVATAAFKNIAVTHQAPKSSPPLI